MARAMLFHATMLDSQDHEAKTPAAPPLGSPLEAPTPAPPANERAPAPEAPAPTANEKAPAPKGSDAKTTPAPVQTQVAPDKPLTERLPENVAATLSYLLGWVSGLFFLLADRRPFVRYHATQSVVVFASLSLLMLVLGDFMLGSLIPQAGSVLLVLRRVVDLVWIVAALGLMLKANAGERSRVPFAARFADRAARVRKS